MDTQKNEELGYVVDDGSFDEYMRRPGVGPIGQQLGLDSRHIRTSRYFTFAIENMMATDPKWRPRIDS